MSLDTLAKPTRISRRSLLRPLTASSTSLREMTVGTLKCCTYQKGLQSVRDVLIRSEIVSTLTKLAVLVRVFRAK
jgi:hypothetical protein